MERLPVLDQVWISMFNAAFAAQSREASVPGTVRAASEVADQGLSAYENRFGEHSRAAFERKIKGQP